MAKAFSERPRWQRWVMIGGWSFVGLVAVTIIAAPDKPSGSSVPTKAVDLAGVRTAFERLGLPCDVAQLQVGDGLSKIGSGDRVALAQAVSGMEARCSQAWQGVDDIALPDDLTDAQEGLADTMTEECKMAFWQRKELADKLVPVVDGDMRPSVIADLQTDMAAMQGAVARCGAALDALAPKPAPSPSAE